MKQDLNNNFDDLILKELNEHLKALITLCMDNKRDLDYIKFKLEKLEYTIKETKSNNTEEIPLINIKKSWDWKVPSFDILSKDK
ncbi:MAG: hypothetical protein ACKOXV_06945 [Bacteroidota bacterium]